MKKVVASILIFQLLFLALPVQGFSFAEETTTVIIHYVEQEGNDKDWNLWIWPSGGEGSVYEFTQEDNFGKVAMATFSGPLDEVGFIVRTDDWVKDTPSDRFINQFDNGVGEIWVVGGQEDFYYENPNGPAGIQSESVDLTLHYNNYTGDYHKVKATVAVEGQPAQAVELTEDSFGVLATLTVDDTLLKPEILVNIVDNDQEVTYSVKKVRDGHAEVFFVENNDRVYYSESDAIYQPLITEAKLSNTKTIQLAANMPFQADQGELEVKVNGEVKAVASFSYEPFNEDFISPDHFVISLAEPVNYTDEITVSIPKFETAKVQLGDVYDTEEFIQAYSYQGELGPIYREDKTVFNVWAPTAQDMDLYLYDKYNGEGTKIDMIREEQGVWTVEVSGDLHNQLYDYAVKHQAEYIHTVDPYAKAVTVNGSKSAVVDLDRTNPENWDEDYQTNFTNPTDAIMYEIHVRDLSMHNESGIENKGKFLGFTELNTTNGNGYSTGLSYIKELGVTHIQLMPVYDYGSIDESKDDYQFNWGYDPVNYNALEGSYSTDPYTPDVRIKEFKQAVQAIHDNGLHVTMDVVYNHVFSLNAMAFEKLVPGYYFRKEANGNYANGSGCGNETASERPMMRKFMIDSVTYLAKEYHLDGFRFDLMGLHDVDTMNQIRTALNAIDPSITIIGEGWNMGNVLNVQLRSNQQQADEMPGIAHFNDTIRDGLKGSVFDSLDQGFVNGKAGMEGTVFSGIVGGVLYGDYSTWGDIDPTQSVTYVEAHDNNTLFDKLNLSNPEDDYETIKEMHLLADSIILTSQGIPFIHAGQEFLRTKFGDENSYKSSDIINRLDWKQREKNDDVVNYFKGLIAIRKAHPSFRMTTSEAVNAHLTLLQASDDVIAYTLDDVKEDTWQHIVVIHNANHIAKDLALPASGDWLVVAEGQSASADGLRSLKGDKAVVKALSTMILVQSPEGDNLDAADASSPIYIYIIGASVILALGALVYIKRKI